MMNELDAKKQKMENEIDEVIQKRIYKNGVSQMDDQLLEKMLDILSACKDMTITTLRFDGWPQANTVGFVHIGQNIYFETFKTASKANNIERDPRVSITVSTSYKSLAYSSGLSIAARVESDKKAK